MERQYHPVELESDGTSEEGYIEPRQDTTLDEQGAELPSELGEGPIEEQPSADINSEVPMARNLGEVVVHANPVETTGDNPDLHPANNLVTTSELAQTLGVSPYTIRKWANDNKIPSLRTPGGHRRYNMDQIQSVIDNFQPGEKLLTSGEAARMVGVDVRTIKRWVREGKITCLRTLGGNRLILSSSLYVATGVEIDEEEFDYTMKINEAAAHLGISEGRLRRLTDSNNLDSIRTAGNHRHCRASQIKAIATLLERRSKEDIETLRNLGLNSLLT